MGNLFIGFPVPRAKIATMIEEAAPPLDHIINHLPDGTDPIADPGDIDTDQILQWDGTKFIGTPAPSEDVPEHYSTHEPDGSDPLALPGDLGTDQLLQWDGTKFVGIDEPAAGGVPSPISISPFQFHPIDDQHDFLCDEGGLRTRTDLGANYFFCPLNLPHGVTITKLTVFAYRPDPAAPANLYLYRFSNTRQTATLANVTIDWTSGNSSGYDDSINFEVIDNANYSYFLRFYTNPNDSTSDVILARVMIDFT